MRIFRHILLISVLSMLSCFTYGQAKFSWKLSETEGNEVLLTFSGILDEGWHVSSSMLEIEQQDGLRPIGGLSESVEGSGNEGKSDRVVYQQRFSIIENSYHLRGYLQYILCTDVACLAPQTMEFDCQGGADAKADEVYGNVGAKGFGEMKGNDAVLNASIPDSIPAVIGTEGYAVADMEFIYAKAWRPVIKQLREYDNIQTSSLPANEAVEADGMLRLFLLAFAGGLLALLTPCVWPMIPLTVSFFMHRGDKRGEKGGGVMDAALFGLCIVAIFLMLGFLLTVLFGANALNSLSTSAVFNVACFVLLVLFGLSLFGVFELRLPSSWADALDRKSTSTTGIVSIFLMALTMVVVSFSCTAPVIGMLLVEIASAATEGEGAVSLLTPMVGMSGFALALALPFSFFALFPSLLQRIPRSGRWMTSVRVTLGFLELAFALKFLSVADLAYGWGILPRNVFICIWMVLAFTCGVYHSVNWEKGRINPLGRQKTAIVCYAFFFYLLSGLHGAPCTLVSAFLPPSGNIVEREFADYDEALAEAAKQGKPVFIDFTGYGCVNCRKMEAVVFSDAKVHELLYKEFVVLRLFVDDRTPLPRQFTVDGRVLRTVGDKWALLESRKFGSMAQPFYVIVNAEGEPLTCSYAYNESIPLFIQWLKGGIQ